MDIRGRVGWIVWIVLLCGMAFSQGVVGTVPQIQTGISASLPATCVVGQLYFTTGTPGIYSCNTTNNWTAIGSGGSSAFGSLTGGTNTTAAMVIGTGSSLTVSGSGTNTATGLTGSPAITVSSCTGCGGAVSSVSDSGAGTLTVSPTTGAVLASLNLGNANTWTAQQTFGLNISIGGVVPTGTTGSANLVFSASPTLTGTLNAAAGVFSGTLNANASTTGTAPAVCGTASGCIGATEGTAANMTITAGQDAFAADSTAHAYKMTLNGGSIFESAMNANISATNQSCADSSGSGTAQTCNTAVIFTPVADNCVIYTTTTTNSGAGLTINVNSLTAKSVAIPGASGWTTTLTASIIPANTPLLACYTGTNWNVQQTGTSASGGGVTSWTGDSVLHSNSASTGAVTETLINQAAKAVFVGPRFGSAAAPSVVTSPSPLYFTDPTAWVYFFDDFQCNTAGGAWAPGTCLGWAVGNGTVAVDGAPTGTGTTFGVISCTTGAVSGNACQLIPQAVAGSGFTSMITYNAANGDMYIRFDCPTATVSCFVGVGNNANGEAGNNAIGVGYDTNQSDTHWMCVTKSGGTATRTSLANTPDANFHTVHIRLSAGTIGCQLDGGTEVTQSTNVPTAQMSPDINIITRTTAGEKLEADYFYHAVSASR